MRRLGLFASLTYRNAHMPRRELNLGIGFTASLGTGIAAKEGINQL
jgi:hypothetical protein